MVSAVQYSTQTLREKPNFGEAVLFLEENLSKTYDDLIAKAKKAEGTENWEEAYALYSLVKSVSDAVSTLPAQIHPTTKASVSFAKRNVDSEIEIAAQNAAEKNYQMAVAFESVGKHKDAAKAYTVCMKYVHGYKDAQAKYDRSRTAAIKRVAVMPFDNTSGKSEYGDIGDNFASQMIASAMADPVNLEFLEFVSRDRLNQLIAEQELGQSGTLDQSTAASVGKVLGIHAFVFGKVTSVVPNFPSDITVKTTDERDISLGKDKGTAHIVASVYTTTRKGSAKLTATYQIIDVEQGTIVKSGSCTKDVSKEIKWATFKGNESALSSSSEALCQRGEEALPPVEELVIQSVQGAAEDLARQIAAFFN